MDLTPLHQFSKVRVERPIAALRIVLAASSFLAIWVDPVQPASYVTSTYTLHAIYVGYALVLAALMWRRSSDGRLPLATHITDVAVAAVLQGLTLGPSSPFFTYFVFALFAAALRWGWRATVRTGAVVLATFVIMGVSMWVFAESPFEMDRFIIRLAYLVVVTVLLVYLGQHEARMRDDLERLARWPRTPPGEARYIAPKMLEYATGIVGAGQAMVVWEADDEPWMFVASWSPSGFVTSRHAPAEIEPVVPEPLAGAIVVCADPLTPEAVSFVSRAGKPEEWQGLPIHPVLLARLSGVGLGSAPFRTERVSGRVFFSDLSASAVEILPLLEVVGREMGASIDQIYSYERSRQLAVVEDRIELARDLHDGVLQALTGIRLELQSMGTAPAADPHQSVRLLALERALAIEQRELRCFIEDLRPSPAAPQTGSLADRLDDLRTRMALEWKAPITLRVSPALAAMPAAVDHAIPLMVHEAVVNALKHGHPSRVSVDVQASDSMLRIVVSDDGQGFPRPGRFEHAALVRSNSGPVSLRERVAALGGEIAIDSTGAGARVELSVPLSQIHA